MAEDVRFEPGSLPAWAERPPGEWVTGIVLAGGRSRRMGRDKAFLELGGRPLIEIVVACLQQACNDIVIVAADVGPYRGLGVPVERASCPSARLRRRTRPCPPA